MGTDPIKALSWVALAGAIVVLSLGSSPVRCETIAERFAPPEGFVRTKVPEGSVEYMLRHWKLRPEGTPANDWMGNLVFQPDEIGGVLEWRLLGSEEQCADIAIRLYADHAWDNGRADQVNFLSLSGQAMEWTRWLGGRYQTNADQTKLEFIDDTDREPSEAEFEQYLRFVMRYANTASLARDWPKVDTSNLSIGDVLIQPHCTGQGMGHLSVIVDACVDSVGSELFIFVDGYTPARVPVVRIMHAERPESAWMIPGAYLILQEQFGPGEFHRFPGW